MQEILMKFIYFNNKTIQNKFEQIANSISTVKEKMILHLKTVQPV